MSSIGVGILNQEWLQQNWLMNPSVLSLGVPPSWWHSTVWKWHIPPKMQIFIWLVLENRILTWDNLTPRGFTGPNVCPLRWCAAESCIYLFFDCHYLHRIWDAVKLILPAITAWTGESISCCFHNWIRDNPGHIAMPSSSGRYGWQGTLVSLKIRPLILCGSLGRLLLYFWTRSALFLDSQAVSKCVPVFPLGSRPGPRRQDFMVFFYGASQQGGHLAVESSSLLTR